MQPRHPDETAHDSLADTPATLVLRPCRAATASVAVRLVAALLLATVACVTAATASGQLNRDTVSLWAVGLVAVLRAGTLMLGLLTIRISVDHATLCLSGPGPVACRIPRNAIAKLVSDGGRLYVLGRDRRVLLRCDTWLWDTSQLQLLAALLAVQSRGLFGLPSALRSSAHRL